MNTVTATVYWVIVAIWAIILSTVVTFYVLNRRTFGTTRLLLAVLALDAVRNIVENIYFGFYFGAKYGVFPSSFQTVLGQPVLLILPKLGNIAAGCLVLGLLLFKCLPEAIRERARTEEYAAHLHRLATTDSMTGLRNRGDFMAVAETEWEWQAGGRGPLALMIIDIDFFKSINDRYGHQVGDQVIIMVTELCQANKRAGDIAGRLGGEEFAILLRNTDDGAAYSFAERLRSLVEDETLALGDGMVSVTVSIGVTCSLHADSLAELFRQADAALYTGKRTGRNRVCRFGTVNDEAGVAPMRLKGQPTAG
jgi:diguanylate cyclase (GGDEF)-like protein